MSALQVIAGQLEDCPVFRIAPNETNKFVILCDSEIQPTPFVMVVEIFDAHGQTPPNMHRGAFEHFYVLAGTGSASAGDNVCSLQPGTHLLVPPGLTHQIKNTGTGRLYLLTTMVPDEDFARLIRSGVPASLDEEDRRVLIGDREE